jgi:hypothetical protein
MKVRYHRLRVATEDASSGQLQSPMLEYVAVLTLVYHCHRHADIAAWRVRDLRREAQSR